MLNTDWLHTSTAIRKLLIMKKMFSLILKQYENKLSGYINEYVEV